MSFTCQDCQASIPGTNCAYELSRQMGWKKKKGCYAHCHCGYPVRAKEVAKNIFGDCIDTDTKSKTNAFIYCESASGGGHVYYGTYDTCVRGNGYTAAQMNNGQGATVFERHT